LSKQRDTFFRDVLPGNRLENLHGQDKVMNPNEHLSPAAIQAAKLFWFDSIGCALGGGQQDAAKIPPSM
jgi:hypothetical protein